MIPAGKLTAIPERKNRRRVPGWVSCGGRMWTARGATVGVFTDLSDVVLTGITPGSSHTLRACAMAADNQTSDWCTPMTVICTYIDAHK